MRIIKKNKIRILNELDNCILSIIYYNRGRYNWRVICKNVYLVNYKVVIW